MSYDASKFYERYNLQFQITNLDVERQHTERIENYRRFWNAYRSKVTDIPDVDTKDFTQVNINYNRIFVDALVHFMAGKGVKPYTPYNQVLQDFLNKVWDMCNKGKKVKEIVRTGKVAGDVFTKIIPYLDNIHREPIPDKLKTEDDIKTETEVQKEISSVEDLHNKLEDANKRVIDEGLYVMTDEFDPGTVKQEILVLDEKRVFPVYAYTPRKELISCTIFSDGVSDDGDSFTLKEVWTKTTISVYKNDTLIMGYPVPNYLGYIPVVHIPNIEVKNSDFGESDMQRFYNTCYIFNDVIRDIRGIVRYFSSPMTVLVGASLKSMVVGPDKTYAIPKGADLKHVEMNTDLPAANKFLELIKQAMHEESGVHARSLGGTENAISNTTGVALHTEYFSLIRVTDLCKDNYTEGFKKMNRIIIGYGFVYGGLMIFVEKTIARMLEELGFKNPEEAMTVIQGDPQFAEKYPIDKVSKLLAALTLKLDILKTSENGAPSYFKFMKEGTFAKWVEDMDIGLAYSLPKDTMMAIQNIRDRKDIGLIHRKDALRSLDVDDPDRYLQEVERDELAAAQHRGKMQQLEMGDMGGMGATPGGEEGEIPEGEIGRRDTSEKAFNEKTEGPSAAKGEMRIAGEENE
jgi:hypothetical protein